MLARLAVAAILCAAAGHAKELHALKIDDNLYRGHQPGKEDYARLKQIGIKTVLDLRGGPIHKPREAREVHAAGMDYVSVRLSGIWEPKDEQIARILAILEDPARTPVFLHCRRGDDRTGMVIACYRMDHYHWNKEQALQEAHKDGMSMFEVFMKRYIRHFDALRLHAPQTAIAAGGR